MEMKKQTSLHQVYIILAFTLVKDSVQFYVEDLVLEKVQS